MNTAQTVAHSLLAIKAVFLRPNEPFTWASGIKSPIYTDNRLVLTAPAQRNLIEEALAERIRTHFPEAEVLMGTATAGIAHAALAADRLGLPMGYVRSSAKDHGRTNRIEGKLEPGAKVVVVEDLISTAGSVIDVVNALRDAGGHVCGIVALFTYGMEAASEALAASRTTLTTLTTFDDVIDAAVATGQIHATDIPRLRAFRDNPRDESWMNEQE
ncbi:orotate phosphoribosyltransferase [Arcanobacterium haemolyticum]|uniref:Orotate phosphoribosyltransferase n=1 Tax=Arcanobacterium haemolyticum (strain ATCC 9345 / DSM 20595 / CCM 5947 / CCUG 17215 / LMG 16163 / NBRC 15585 / NCTC 8452 / 11018) TaxID=644284 RepID=D7BP91_ARCHD|nr:orotate phosphoribosyltransferase [Arcanobacterium haemolyticum]ADH92740.1 orotate phosphoribosyltransferase [Arcanobacterium haemolyticum DSM 20595]QCX46844.1 orotate phosphoribosyltransferase [Arcanobacterium haemolyticum]SQH28519.1 Orotate phosphoribosyltransferase [Arcanobacterium haemolyticum]